jgi:hypothetical protein
VLDTDRAKPRPPALGGDETREQLVEPRGLELEQRRESAPRRSERLDERLPDACSDRVARDQGAPPVERWRLDRSSSARCVAMPWTRGVRPCAGEVSERASSRVSQKARMGQRACESSVRAPPGMRVPESGGAGSEVDASARRARGASARGRAPRSAAVAAVILASSGLGIA